MHAKKTRDRKKFFLETSEKIINEMEKEAHQLREYLLKLGVISEEECKKLQLRELEAKKELASLKVSSNFMVVCLVLTWYDVSIRFIITMARKKKIWKLMTKQAVMMT